MELGPYPETNKSTWKAVMRRIKGLDLAFRRTFFVDRDVLKLEKTTQNKSGLNKTELVMDREAWRAAIHGGAKSRT